MGGGRSGRFWGAPIFGRNLENTAFFHQKDAKIEAPSETSSQQTCNDG